MLQNAVAAGSPSWVKVRAAWHSAQSQASQKTKKSKGRMLALGRLTPLQLCMMGFEGWELRGLALEKQGGEMEIGQKKKPIFKKQKAFSFILSLVTKAAPAVPRVLGLKENSSWSS